MKKERCGLKKLHKGFWLCLCAVALVVTCCVVALHNVQAAESSDLSFEYYNSDNTSWIVSGYKNINNNELIIPATHEGLPVVAIGREAFLGCEDFARIEIPSSVTSIGWYAFSGCTGLTEITIPDSVTEMDWFAFSNCTGLETVTIGSGVTEISAGAFSGCTKLKTVAIEKSAKFASGTEKIGWSAFKDCTSLENIVLPSSMKTIDRYAFYNCNNLQNVYYNHTAASWDTITISEDGNDSLSNALKNAATSVHFSDNVLNNLRMQDRVRVGYLFDITTNGPANNVEYGMLVWAGEEIKEPIFEVDGSTANGVTAQKLEYSYGYYTGEGEGIYAQRLDQNYYARPYAKIGEEYVYGNVVAYSPLEYARKTLESEGTDEKTVLLKKMMVDMLNYGAYAQKYFAKSNGTPLPEKLINDMLSDTDKELASIVGLTKETPVLEDQPTPALTTKWAGTNLDLLGAIQMNMAMKNSSVTGMQYWVGADYNAVDWNNAKDVEAFNNEDWAIGSIQGIVAQDIDKWYCVRAYDAEKQNFSEVRVDSIAAYATRLIEKYTSEEDEPIADLAKALILYGNSAKAYFNLQNG